VTGESSLRIGFIGAGVIAWAHAHSLRSLIRAGIIDAELAAVHDRDRRKAAEMSDRLGMESLGSPDEVAERCDAVYACTSTAGHLASAAAAARYGRALFCEKPLARSLPDSRALVRLVADAGIAAQAGLVLRTAPVYRELATLVGGGTLGRPMAAVMRDDQFFPIQGHYASTWRKDAAEAGSGALLEHAIHDVDAARWCFGEVSSVTSSISNFAGYEGIEDTAAGVLRHEGGATVALVSVWHSVLSRPSTRRVEAFFEHGFVGFDDDFTGPMTIQTSDETVTRRCDPPAYVDELRLPEGHVGIAVRPYIEENRNFVDAVTAGRQPEPSLAEALRAHEIVDAWYRSAEAGGEPASPRG
jgi:predicted dehydrogenase